MSKKHSPIDSDVWTESFEEIAHRWRRRRKDDALAALPMEDIATAAALRADKVLAYLKARPLPPLDTPRKWQAFWNAAEAKEMLVGLLRRFQWEPLRLPGTPDTTTAPVDAQRRTENVVLLYEGALAAAAERAAEAGSPYGLTPLDFEVFTLAAELYEIAKGKMGKPERDAWLALTARSRFQRKLLGLPFEPLLFELL